MTAAHVKRNTDDHGIRCSSWTEGANRANVEKSKIRSRALLIAGPLGGKEDNEKVQNSTIVIDKNRLGTYDKTPKLQSCYGSLRGVSLTRPRTIELMSQRMLAMISNLISGMAMQTSIPRVSAMQLP